MGRISTFLLGGILGAVLVCGALKYHLVHAQDGLHLVPKRTMELSGAYVDIRDFGPEQWSRHRALIAALIQAGKGDLIGETAALHYRRSVHQALDGLLGSPAR
jgi:hypothetical protein